MLDYDREAAQYDATRGGDARAEAAADAIQALLPAAGTARIADVGCGTGIVTVRLLRPGLPVAGIDRSARMAAVAAAGCRAGSRSVMPPASRWRTDRPTW